MNELTLHNANATAEGVSADNVLMNLRAMGSTIALIRDSAKLVALCADSKVNIRTLFRAAGDDPAGNPLGQSAQTFVDTRVNAAPQASWIHLTNEIGFSSDLDKWTRAAVQQVITRGKTAVALNMATNQDIALWKQYRPLLEWLRDKRQYVGVHLYIDSTHDDGGLAPLDYLKSLNCPFMVTEFAPIKSIFDANTGYLGMGWGADEFNAFMDAWSARLAPYNAPLFGFSEGRWPLDNDGNKGFQWGSNAKIVQHFSILNAQYKIGVIPPVNPLPPIYPNPTQPVDAVVALPAGVNLRSAPDTSANNVMRAMPAGERVTVYEQPAIASGVYVMLRVDTLKGEQGWSAQKVNGKDSFVPYVPSGDTNKVVIPKVSYFDEFRWKDGWSALCGQTSLYMLLCFDRQKNGVAFPPESNPYTIALYLGKGAKDFTSLEELQKAGKAYGLALQVVKHYTAGDETDLDILALLMSQIYANKPVICLIDYSKLPTRSDKQFAGLHILVVCGYSDQSVIVHDPDSQGQAGKYLSYPRADFGLAWSSAGNTALVLST